MHRLIEEHLEDILSGAGLPEAHPARRHLNGCAECRSEVELYSEQSALLRSLRAPQEIEPRPGFYARVWERIEAQRPASIWDVFAASVMGRGLAMASLALMVAMSAFLFTTESRPQTFGAGTTFQILPGRDFPEEVLAVPALDSFTAADSQRGAVLVSLATYRER